MASARALAPPPTPRTWVRALAIAALLYAVASLLAVAPILPAPSRLVTGLANGPRVLDRTDQQMVLATIVGNARRLVSRPGLLRDEGQCFPLPKAYALGEHMFGEGVLAAPAWLLSRDPILSFNSMLVLRLWIPAMAMFAFVFHTTRNGWAAFLAGLLYGVHHYRVTDPVHAFVHGDMWLPLGLLCVHRLFEGGRWWPVAGLSLAVSLSVLESLYPLLAVVIVLTTYTSFLAVKFPSRIPRAAPRIALALVAPLLVAWWVFAPYLELKDSWGVLQGIAPMFADAGDYLPRGSYFPGATLGVLAIVGLADRLRGPRETAAGDPRWAIAVAGFLCFWSSIYFLPLPFTGLRLPSPLSLGIGIVPGLDSARSLVLVKIGFVSCLAILAGYGVLAIVDSVRTKARVVVVALLASAGLLETLHPSVQPMFYGHLPRFEAYEGGIRGIYRTFVEDVRPPVLDVPMNVGVLSDQAHYLQWAAYHGGSTAACYNSFPSPVSFATDEIASRLPDPRAARALAAIGFRSVVLHGELIESPADRAETTTRFLDGASPALEPHARGGHHVVFRLPRPGDVRPTFDALTTPPSSAAPEVRVESSPEGEDLPVVFEAAPGSTYRHPEPLAPSDLIATWELPGGATVGQTSFRGLLPLAIAGGDRSTRRLPVPLPPALGRGSFVVRVSRAEDPERPLGVARVSIP